MGLMMNTYCSLFDKNYLDKGIAMIQSLRHEDPEAKIYVLCMDDLCYSILGKLSLNGTVLISFDSFSDEKLLQLKKERGNAEFCWSCTARLIQYVLIHYQENICTYVDADLYFYSNPHILVQEMLDSHCSVQVVSHRFTPDKEGEENAKHYGRNCVQFNTFLKEERSLKLLSSWIDQCQDDCSSATVGDQFYTDSWGDYPFVNVSKNGGAGAAPWNIHRYKAGKTEDVIYDRYDRKSYELVFYHFAQITYLERYRAYIRPPKQHWKADIDLIHSLYSTYLNCLEQIKQEILKNYGFLPLTVDSDVKTNPQTVIHVSSLKSKGIAGLLKSISNHLLVKLRLNDCFIDISRGQQG